MKNWTLCLIAIVLLITCSSKKIFDHGVFEIGISQGVLNNDEINEASGLAYSAGNPSMLWAHNDSGDEARIFLINDKAEHKATFYLKDLVNRDWEDIAVGPGPDKDKNYVYIAEIGDNFGIFKYKYIYRIEEPSIRPDTSPITGSINKVDSIKFQLSDGPRDSEAIVVDPATRDIYIFSKREEKQINMYVLHYPQSTKEILTARFVMHIPFTQIVAADISADGTEVLLKNYKNVYYWKKRGNETFAELLRTPPAHLPYVEEPQGEAITFDRTGKGYYTVSEVANNKKPHLIFYKRKTD